MEEQQIFGKLFNRIPLLTENHIDILLQTMDKETSIYYLTQAISYAYEMGVFSIGEVEILSKAIRISNRNSEEKVI